MNYKAKVELGSIKTELNSIIRELESIQRGVKNDFVGIGNDRCAQSIGSAISQYYIVKKKLDNIDTVTVTEGFVAPEG